MVQYAQLAHIARAAIADWHKLSERSAAQPIALAATTDMAEVNFFEAWGKENPDTLKAFFEYAGVIQNKCGLDEKTFQLVYIAIQASRGGIGSVSGHSAFAKAAGATREEVIGAVLVTLMTSGINGVADALTAAIAGYDGAAPIGN
ncbi:MAG: carboxymuconolactone decarboxylase family protein [Oscillospiraceae bacterium]|jgi:alkylhydroperoxidase/carboxymuconolactone decarboxylase family protein YurZ|nr:carboxymuconolactone decarboxylase family protein [Oscillospiraceae bacterium]